MNNRIYSLRIFENLKAQRLQRLKNRRKLWLKVHLWLGLGLGLFLAIIGLTGSVLVFWHELDQVLNPSLYQNSTLPGTTKTLDKIIAAGERAAPPGWTSITVEVPREVNGNYLFSFYYPNISPPPEQAQSLNIAVDAYSAKVVGRRVFYHAWNPLKHCLVGFFFKLHYALFLGEIGVTLVGSLAVLFLVSVLSGLILWWPLTGNWRRVLTIKRHASIERFNHDLHQTSGFYSLIVLLAVLISGVYFNLPDQFRWLVERFSPITQESQATTETIPSIVPISLALALQLARHDYPGGTPGYYSFDNNKQGLLTACFRDVVELQRYVISERCLVLNRSDGKLLKIKDPAHGSGGDLFMQ
jgi:uncharacterized iron-regulated membrane protein